MNEDLRNTSLMPPSAGQDWNLLLHIFDALACSAFLISRSGAVTAANRTFEEATGLKGSGGAALSAELLELHLPGLKEHLAELRGGGSRIFHSRLTGKEGRSMFAELTLLQLETEDEAVLCVGRGLHELTVGQEAALRRAEEQLTAANRLKRKFIANINHAIRTPMNAIIGYAEILAESGLSEQQQRFVGAIRKNGAALVSIINDVLELSKLESGNVKVMKAAANLCAVIEQAADLFSDQIRAKKLEFSCAVQPELPEMYVMDAEHCRQVLINLISNAVKFTDRGQVTLTVSGRPDGLENSWELSFRVEDSGIGIAAEELRELRELFEQEDGKVRLHDGTRLGLTLCARLARMMGGSLRVESIQGHGSSFTFTMPAKTARRAGADISPPSRSCARAAESKRGPVMLVVDDMPEMSHLIKLYFTNSPIRVLEASTPESCRELALTEQPDLILMDLDLAGADGRELAKQLKEDERTAQAPIVVMTGLMLERDSLKPLFEDFLPKPFHLQELRQLVEKYLPARKSALPAETRHPWTTPASSDLEQMRAAWSGELDATYAEAQMSGNLEDALALGRAMEEQGLRADAAALGALGREMKRFAMDLDIRGVEQVLSALRKIAGEKQ
uniref:hybrid sensor histidine kinase/response regulator n=1 Tax=Candidatus Electronema sp. TaxID=2698783 RepID=UPI0040570D36